MGKYTLGTELIGASAMVGLIPWRYFIGKWDGSQDWLQPEDKVVLDGRGNVVIKNQNKEQNPENYAETEQEEGKNESSGRPKRGSNRPRYLEDYVAKWCWAGNTFQKQNPPILQSWLPLDAVPFGFAISQFLQDK